MGEALADSVEDSHRGISRSLESAVSGAVYSEAPDIEGITPPAWWRALFVLVFNTGLRRGSLFSLRTDDGDWQRSTIKIPGKRMKTGNEHRLPLNDVVIAHLRAIKLDRKLLLPWPHCGSWFDKNFHRLQTACGIPRAEHVGLYQLSRTNVTELWRISPEAARLVARHSSNRTTVNHYVNNESIMAEAVKLMPQPEVSKGVQHDATQRRTRTPRKFGVCR